MDDGPVELTDPGRVALDAGEDEPGMADAEIIWDDPPPEATRRAGRSPAREQPAQADESDPFWEEDLTRAAAVRSPETPSDDTSRMSRPAERQMRTFDRQKSGGPAAIGGLANQTRECARRFHNSK